jgi:hypothetical protein
MGDALERIQGLFGIRGDGISYQTKRALLNEGELAPTPAVPAAAPIEPTQGIGGPSLDPATLQRIQAAQRAQGDANLRRLMEQRAKLIQGLPQ